MITVICDVFIHKSKIKTMYLIKVFTLTLLCCILLSLNSFAQTDKGTWTVGSGLNFSGGKSGARSYISFGLSPRAGYFLKDNWMLGASTLYSMRRGRGSYEIQEFGGGLFSRYYFDLKRPKIKPYFSLDIFYNRTERTAYTVPDIRRDVLEQYTFTPGGGLAMFLSPHVALELQADYKPGSPANTGLYNDLQFSLGVQAYLFKKKKD